MPLSAADVDHFCRRVGFGATNAEIQHFVGREVGDVVDEVLDLRPSTPGRPGFLSHREWWEDRPLLVDWWTDRMIGARWVNRSAATPSPLIEKLTLFWHGHFACGMEKVSSSIAMYDQNQLFRLRCLGDFETLVQRVSVGGAMLRYIDNATNVKGAEQENFGRELMELHTIGVGNFTEPDVVAMARAWTGHNIVGWNSSGNYWDTSYRFVSSAHDSGSKTLFGKTRNWNGPQTVTELVKGSKRSATSKFIARKLWLYFVNGEPTDAQVNQIAGAFSSGGMSVRAAMKAILTHPAFWAAGSRRALVRSPIEWSVDVLRRMGMSAEEGELTWLTPKMGQFLFEPPNVAGWGTHDYWISTTTAWGKGRFVRHIGWQSQPQNRFKPLEDMTRTQAVTRIASQLGLRQLSPASRTALGTWFDVAKSDYKWTLKHNALRIGAMLPEFQTA